MLYVVSSSYAGFLVDAFQEGHDVWKPQEMAPGLKSPSRSHLTEGSLWQADHVVPVWRGGGLCGLENLQTLCSACHSEKTKKEAEERKEQKARVGTQQGVGGCGFGWADERRG